MKVFEWSEWFTQSVNSDSYEAQCLISENVLAEKMRFGNAAYFLSDWFPFTVSLFLFSPEDEEKEIFGLHQTQRCYATLQRLIADMAVRVRDRHGGAV